MKKTILRKYAHLIAESGVNVQKGQEVFIVAGLDQPDFVAMVVDECYKLGAKRVVVDWAYQPLEKLHVRHQSVRTLAELTDLQEARYKHFVENLPCRIYLDSDDPDGLKGINQKKQATARQRRYPLIKGYEDAMENRYQWCIAAVPGAAWAKKLFPKLSKRQAIEKLWEAILYTSRVTDDPVAAWKAHNEELHRRCAWLNGLGIEKLHYTAGNGTDFTVGMIPEAEFKGGGDRSLSGVFFNPNIPTEECFISPMRGVAEGIVYASKPLSRDGQLIDDFWIRFREGKAVEWHAELNNNLLTHIIKTFMANSERGQLIFTTHCLMLLDEDFIRRDMVYFTNKNEAGATEIYRAKDFGLHKDVSILNAYRGGKLGAKPNLGSFFI